MTNFKSRLSSSNAWVDPHSLPKYGDASLIDGSASTEVKQLTNNTLGAYGVGDPDCFAHVVGKAIVMVKLDVHKRDHRMEATAQAEVVVTKSEFP